MERTFSEFLDRVCRQYAPRPAIQEFPDHPEKTLTYAQLAQKIRDRVEELKGRRTIIVRGTSSADWIITMFASAAGGHQTVLEGINDPEIPATALEAVPEYHPRLPALLHLRHNRHRKGRRPLAGGSSAQRLERTADAALHLR
jgi:hypothetical protein